MIDYISTNQTVLPFSLLGFAWLSQCSVSRIPPALAASPEGSNGSVGRSAWLTTRTPATTAGPLGGSPIDPRRVLAHAVVPLCRRDRAGEIARTPGARPQRRSARCGRRGATTGP